MIENLAPLQFNMGMTIGITAHQDTQWLFPKFKLNNLCIQTLPQILALGMDGKLSLQIHNALNLVRRNTTHGAGHMVGDEEVLHILRPTKSQFISGLFQTDRKSLNWVPIKAKELNLSDYAIVHPDDYKDTPQDELIRGLAFARDIDVLIFNKPNVFLRTLAFSPQKDLKYCTYSIFGGDYLDHSGQAWDDLSEEDRETASSMIEEYNTIISDADVSIANGLFIHVGHDQSEFYIQVEGEQNYQKVSAEHIIEMGARYYEELSLYYIPPKLKLLGIVNGSPWYFNIWINVRDVETLATLFPKAAIVEADSFDIAVVEETLKNYQGLVIWVLPTQNTAFHFTLDHRLKLDDVDKIIKESREYAEEMKNDQVHLYSSH